MVRHRSLFGPAALAALLVLGAGAVGLTNTTSATASSTKAAPVAAGEVGTLAASAGCGRAPGLNSGTHTIQSGGKSRSFILRVPANYNQNNPYRLVFGFHWLGGTAVDVDTGQTVQRDVWSYYGLRQLANNTTIFVAPQGLNNGWANSGGEDVTFVDDMLRQIESNLCVETTLRFALGFSYGGGMSFALACARPNVFRAVAVYAGGQISGCSGGTGRIAYLGAHGLSDNVLSISGGRTLRDRFVTNNGCTRQNPPEPAVNSRTHITTELLRMRGRLSGALDRLRRRPHPSPQDGGQDSYDLPAGRDLEVLHPVRWRHHPDAGPDHPAAGPDHPAAGPDHPAAGRQQRLPGRGHGQRVEQRPDRGHHHHQHR